MLAYRVENTAFLNFCPTYFQRPLTNIIPELITANSIFIGFLYSVLTTFRATDVSERMRLKIVEKLPNLPL